MRHNGSWPGRRAVPLAGGAHASSWRGRGSPIDCRARAASLLLVALALVAAGCSDSVPGGKVVTPDAGDRHRHGRRRRGAAATPAAGEGGLRVGRLRAPATPSRRRTRPARSGRPRQARQRTRQAATRAAQEFIYELDRRPALAHSCPGFPTSGAMPPFGSALEPKQLADLVAFLAKGSLSSRPISRARSRSSRPTSTGR